MQVSLKYVKLNTFVQMYNVMHLPSISFTMLKCITQFRDPLAALQYAWDFIILINSALFSTNY